MSLPPDPPPPGSPEETVALDPETLPVHPLRAEDCLPLIEKEIG